MTNEKGSEEPSDNAKTQPSSQALVTPAALQQTEMGARGNRDPDHEQNETSELTKDFRTAERWIIGTNIGLGVIGILALCIYYGQLGQMRKATEKAGISADAAKSSADTARDSLIRSQRPWVGMRGFFLPIKVLPNIPLQAKYAQVNSGHGPALSVGNRVGFGILEQKLTNDRGEEKLRETKPPNTYTLFPNAESPAGQASVTINNYWLSQVNAGKAWLYYFGDTTYLDEFGQMHRTKFCAVYNPTAKEFDHCDIFNDAN